MNIRNLYLVIILVLGAFLRFFELGTRPFNGDEGVIALIANNNFSDLITRAASDVHPPLFHLLTSWSIKIFGLQEWSMRLISALAGIGLIYFGYLLAKKFINQKIALIFSLLLVISPYFIYFSQEARMYSLFGFFSLASFYYFLSALKEPKAKYFLAYAISACLMIYTQYLGFVVILAQVIYLFPRFSTPEVKEVPTSGVEKNTSGVVRWLISGLIIIALFLPQLSTAYSQFTARMNEQPQKVVLTQSTKGLVGAFYRFGAGRWILDITPDNLKIMSKENPWQFMAFLLTLLIPLILVIQGLVAGLKKYPQMTRLAIWILIVASVLTLLSAEVGHRANRYLIFAAPFYLLLITFGFNYFWQKKWLKIIPLVLLVIWGISLYTYYFKEQKASGANTVAEYLAKNYQDSEIVMMRGAFGGGEEWALTYYWDRLHVTGYMLQVYDLLGDYRIGNLAELKDIDPQEKAKELLENYNKVWFYDMTYSNYDIQGQPHDLGKDKEGKDLVVWEIRK